MKLPVNIRKIAVGGGQALLWAAPPAIGAILAHRATAGKPPMERALWTAGVGGAIALAEVMLVARKSRSAAAKVAVPAMLGALAVAALPTLEAAASRLARYPSVQGLLSRIGSGSPALPAATTMPVSPNLQLVKRASGLGAHASELAYDLRAGGMGSSRFI